MSKSRDGGQGAKGFGESFRGDDEEAQLEYLGPKPNQGAPVHRVVKEVKRNWWLWGAVCFAVVLITGVVMFRHKLYNTGNFGLPFLAVSENAAEVCAAKCNADALGLAAGMQQDAKAKQEYDTCYSKCVAQETKEVEEEREQFRHDEEEMEKQVEQLMESKAGASETSMSKTDKTV